MKTKRVADWYAGGQVQKVVTYAVYCLLAAILALTLELICKSLILGDLGRVLAEYVPPDRINRAKAEIAAIGGFGPQLFVFVMVSFILAWAVMKLSTRLNLVGTVVLDKALRFTDAMENLGLIHDWEQLQFIQNHKIPVYIATKPLLAGEAEQVKARLYPFIRTFLVSTDFMDASKGRKQLCLKAADLDAALVRLNVPTASTADAPEAEAPGLYELRQQVARLETDKKVFQKELLDARNKITELEAARKSQADDLQAALMRAQKEENGSRRIFLYSVALGPIFQKIAAAKPDRRYVTKKALGELFLLALKRDASLENLFLSLEQKVPSKLPDYICDLIWAALKELNLASDGGAAPSGNLSFLRKIVFTE